MKSRPLVTIFGFVLFGCTPAAPQGCTYYGTAPGSLCASSQACASDPCTVGCTFAEPFFACEFGANPDQIYACPNVCIGVSSPGVGPRSVACVRFLDRLPQCRGEPACGGYPASCYETSQNDVGGVIICDPDEKCQVTEDFDIPDLQTCDAATPADMEPPDDLETLD